MWSARNVNSYTHDKCNKNACNRKHIKRLGKLISDLFFCNFIIHTSTRESRYNRPEHFVDKGGALEKQSIGNGSYNDGVNKDREYDEIAPT